MSWPRWSEPSLTLFGAIPSSTFVVLSKNGHSLCSAQHYPLWLFSTEICWKLKYINKILQWKLCCKPFSYSNIKDDTTATISLYVWIWVNVSVCMRKYMYLRIYLFSCAYNILEPSHVNPCLLWYEQLFLNHFCITLTQIYF